MDKQIASLTITSVSSARQSDQAAYTLLKNFDASKAECGTDEILNGTYDNPNGAPTKSDKAAWLENLWVNSANASVNGGWGARVKDCAKIHYCPADAAQRGLTCIKSGPDAGELSWTNSSSGQTVIWKLVARRRDPHTGEFHEVWQDSHSLKLWGDTLDGSYSHYNSVELNAAGKVVGEKACAPTNDPEQSAVAKSANAGVDDKSWGLPTIKEFQQANDDGITQVLPNMGHWFWSASLVSNSTDDAQDFNGLVGGSFFDFRDSFDSVRCVGR